MREPSGANTGGGRCPICGKAIVSDYRPFCSRRCADVDLSRWLRGRYAIAGREPAAPDVAEESGEHDGNGKNGSA